MCHMCFVVWPCVFLPLFAYMQPLTYEDIEGVDPEYYKNLKWMLEHDITDVLELTFTAETDFFGRKETLELVPGTCVSCCAHVPGE